MDRRSLTRIVKCACGNEMRLLEKNLYRCPTCGRCAWGAKSDAARVVMLVAALTLVSLAALAYVGEMAAQFR